MKLPDDEMNIVTALLERASSLQRLAVAFGLAQVGGAVQIDTGRAILEAIVRHASKSKKKNTEAVSVA